MIGDKDLRVDVATDEIVVSDSHSPTSTTGGVNGSIGQSNVAPVMSTDFPDTENERNMANELFRRYADIFAKSDDDLGCTDTIRHRIRTVDDVPVTTPYRRIPP